MRARGVWQGSGGPADLAIILGQKLGGIFNVDASCTGSEVLLGLSYDWLFEPERAQSIKPGPGQSRFQTATCLILPLACYAVRRAQGRAGLFDDRNDQLLTDLVARYPNVLSLEMETFHLLDLARCSNGTVVAAACCIALADRTTNDFLDCEPASGGMLGLV